MMFLRDEIFIEDYGKLKKGWKILMEGKIFYNKVNYEEKREN